MVGWLRKKDGAFEPAAGIGAGGGIPAAGMIPP
ncbi:MAG: hypothetical protein BWY17_04825 [Deltaproteobacteria bacterium ADurb.Bin207]|nr:MAG: hypothetical protein BWY17_04825 [Deltaproteobacteria bacterium ADurb.Bin207]